MAAELERKFAADGIVAIPDGDKFMMVVPKVLASVVSPRSSEIKSSRNPPRAAQTNKPASGSEELIPAGTINFWGVDAAQAADIYARLVSREMDRSERFPGGPCPSGIFLKTITPLTKEEAIYALETELLWCGVKMVSVGDKMMKAVAAPVPEPAK